MNRVVLCDECHQRCMMHFERAVRVDFYESLHELYVNMIQHGLVGGSEYDEKMSLHTIVPTVALITATHNHVQCFQSLIDSGQLFDHFYTTRVSSLNHIFVHGIDLPNGEKIDHAFLTCSRAFAIYASDRCLEMYIHALFTFWEMDPPFEEQLWIHTIDRTFCFENMVSTGMDIERVKYVVSIIGQYVAVFDMQTLCQQVFSQGSKHNEETNEETTKRFASLCASYV